MCGICGVIWRGQEDLGLVRAMNRRMVHRGPDDEGFYDDDCVSLGMRRLSVIDVHGGHQPISSSDGTCHIVMNGEIYNYADLREQLVSAGHHPRTKSDTEIALLAYRQWGDAFVDRLLGMFCLCIWDGERRRAVIARDRLGKKPLYYGSARNGRVAFASELKCLLADEQCPRELDLTAAGEYLRRGYVTGGNSIIRGIRRLPPGHVLILEHGRAPVEHCYWSPPIPDPGSGRLRWRSIDDAAEELGALLEDATRLRLVSDVPVGAFLSGGLDSSIVVTLMRRAGLSDLKTFSVGFPGEGALDESSFSATVARELGTGHFPLPLDAGSASDLQTLAWQLDEPLADQAAVPTFHLAKLARREVTVVLTGEGADEIFGGYERYALLSAMARLDRRTGPLFRAAANWMGFRDTGFGLAARALRAARGGFADFESAYLAFNNPHAGLNPLQIRGPAFQDFARCSEGGHFAEHSASPLGRMQVMDLQTWLADDLLVKVDRMTMAASLEARCPFLDHRLVELCALLPDEWKIRGMRTKITLRRIGSRILPPSILKRRKHIFAMPIADWLRGPLAALATDTLTPSALQKHGIFDVGTVTEILRRHRVGEDFGRPIWSVLMFQLWYDALHAKAA